MKLGERDFFGEKVPLPQTPSSQKASYKKDIAQTHVCAMSLTISELHSSGSAKTAQNRRYLRTLYVRIGQETPL